jgi:hypothetical protein
MNASSAPKSTPLLARWIPAFGWLRSYEQTWRCGVNRFTTVADAVEAFQKQTAL